ncbi:MAG: class I SAM-dependent methyltransferase [Bacteriovoracaceae bacterium]|nr:class I SAM-dependent methyltransferase [Bacteriovoracaceae bacterium]
MGGKHYDKLILNHYKKVAGSFGLRSSSTMEDPFVRKKEIEFIIEEIQRLFLELKRDIVILDAGCGNGYTLSCLKERFPTFVFYGVEFSPELCELAVSRNLEGVKITNGDIREKDFFKETVDIVITERVIINILNRGHQDDAIANISSVLPDGGLYVMIESFVGPLKELGDARDEMCLDEIEESYQNKYLNEPFVKRMVKYGLTENTPVMPRNYLSSHFYLTRVFHKAMRPDGGKVKFTKMVDFFREAIPPAVGNFSPILFRSFRKISK